MRISERLAVAALILMVAPAFLVFPALGVRWIIETWPGLTTVQHTWFCVSLVSLAFTGTYVLRRHLDAFWYGRTRKISLLEEALVLVPLAVGTWSLTGNREAAFAVFYPRILLWFATILDASTSRTATTDVRAPAKPDDVEPRWRLAQWVRSRRPSFVEHQAITMGPKRARTRRSRGR